jgi:hypothetical protein
LQIAKDGGNRAASLLPGRLSIASEIDPISIHFLSDDQAFERPLSRGLYGQQEFSVCSILKKKSFDGHGAILLASASAFSGSLLRRFVFGM